MDSNPKWVELRVRSPSVQVALEPKISDVHRLSLTVCSNNIVCILTSYAAHSCDVDVDVVMLMLPETVLGSVVNLAAVAFMSNACAKYLIYFHLTGVTCGTSKYPDAGTDPSIRGTPPNRHRRMIVGGWEARPNEFPWQVSLQRLFYYAHDFEHSCGAEILNSQWVLTAAHCVDGAEEERLRIVVGEHDRFYPSHTQVIHTVEKIIIHENYERFGYEYDIALLQVDLPITFTENVQPICLPDPEDNFIGQECVISGWGVEEYGSHTSAQTLRFARVPIINNLTCQTYYVPPSPQITPDMLCAGTGYGVDSCQNDSGGPLACKTPQGEFKLAGVVSWGYGCASGRPGVYANVQYFLDWIEVNMYN